MNIIRGERNVFGFINPEDLNDVKAKIAKLNAKFGKEVYKLTDVRDYESRKRKFLRLDFKIVNPVKDDYTVLAMIDHNDHVIYNWSDEDLEKFRERTQCDHCGTNHRRAKTFIVKTKDGEIKQIGSSCFTKITGSAYTRSLTNFFTDPSAQTLGKIISTDIDDLREKTEQMTYSPRDVVDVAAAIIKKVGFVSVNSTGFGESTCKKVFDAFRGRLELADFDIDKLPKVTDEFAKFIQQNRNNRFLNEVGHILRNEQIHSRTVPALVAGVASWLRDNDKKATEKVQKTVSKKEPINVVKYDGPNKDVECVLERHYTNDSDWGVSETYYFLVDNKYRLRWTTYSGGINDANIGDKFKLERFTIGEHNTSSKIPSTKITRVKVKKI